MSSLRPKHRGRIDPVYGYDSEFAGYQLTKDLVEADKQTAVALIAPLLRPADQATIAGELARMRALTRAKREVEGDLTMIVAAFADELAAYPPDIVRAACRAWSKREAWWPSWAELKAELDRFGRKRRALAESLGVRVMFG